MKKIYIFLFFYLTISSLSFAQNLLADDFTYSPIDSLEGTKKWDRIGINTGYNIKVVSPGLDYKDYVGSAIGNSVLISNSGPGDLVFRYLDSPITSGAVYMSFMLRVDSMPSVSTEGYFISFNPTDGGTNLNTACHIKKLSESSYDLGIRKRNEVFYSNSDLQIHNTYLIVLKYSIVPGNGNDSSSLFIFIKGVPKTEPSTPVTSSIEGDDFSGQDAVYLNNNYAQTGLKDYNIKIDGIRVGTSWETSVLTRLTSVSDPTTTEHFSNENYPNPFNYSTRIKYEIPEDGLVKISIYNSSGTLCKELVNEIQSGGTHEMNWIPENQAAGVYTCKILFNGKGITNKIILIN
ncbi:MAG: T9SS type A sorting domain-containing protein [Saprospiraceae bacterium]